jgi:hypothetical protein
MATDTWLGVSVLGVAFEEAFHPWGLPHAEFATDGFDVTGFTDPPSYDAVLAVRAERVAMVRDQLAALDDADLGAPALHVWAPDVPRAVLQSLHTILAEEWEHLRYALRDLAAVWMSPCTDSCQVALISAQAGGEPSSRRATRPSH